MGTLPDGTDYKDFLNKDSFKVVHGLVDKDAIAAAGKGQPGIDATRLRMQFERLGYL